MPQGKDYLGEKLRLLERSREDHYFQKIDRELIAELHLKATEREQEEATAAVTLSEHLYRNILVPVDFSSSSTEALLQAAVLAERFSASLIILHVVTRDSHLYALQQQLGVPGTLMTRGLMEHDVPEASDEMVETVIHDLREQAYAALKKFLFPGVMGLALEVRVLSGHPEERIIETAINEKVDLIIMGSHGHTSMTHTMIGSVTERVSRLAPCSVLTVKTSRMEAHSWLEGFYQTLLHLEGTAATGGNKLGSHE